MMVVQILMMNRQLKAWNHLYLMTMKVIVIHCRKYLKMTAQFLMAKLNSKMRLKISMI